MLHIVVSTYGTSVCANPSKMSEADGTLATFSLNIVSFSIKNTQHNLHGFSKKIKSALKKRVGFGQKKKEFLSLVGLEPCVR